jgi:hypothetical protein
LERVVHQRRHFAEAPAHQLLDGHCACGIRIAGRDLEAEPVVAKNHVEAPFVVVYAKDARLDGKG